MQLYLASEGLISGRLGNVCSHLLYIAGVTCSESDNESEAPPLVEDSDDESDDGSEPLGEGPDNESDDGMAIDDEPSVPTPEQHARRPRTHPNTIILPVETRPVEELRAGERRTSSRKNKRPAYNIDETYSEGEPTWEENGELVRGINVIERADQRSYFPVGRAPLHG